MMCRLLLNVQQFGLCIAIILSMVSFIYSCFEMFAVKQRACSRMHVYILNSNRM